MAGIPYSRPPAVKALPAPKAPAFKATESVWGGMVPKAPKAPVTSTMSPLDTFTLSEPYNPANLNGLATQGYNTDVANARKIAAIGTTPDAQIASDYAARGAAANGIYQNLQQELAGVQQASVDTGNAANAALGRQDAAIGAPAGVIPTTGAQAVLAQQTANSGNAVAGLEAAALTNGAQANKSALSAGLVAQQTNDQGIAKNFQTLLTGVPTESSRVSDMLAANQKVDAANAQTRLATYTDLEKQKEFDTAEGDKVAEASDSNALKRYTAGLSNTEKLQMGLAKDNTTLTTNAANNATKLKTAGISAAAKTTAAKTAAAAKLKTTGAANPTQRRQQLGAAIKIINTTGGTKTTSQQPGNSTITIQATSAGGGINPLANPVKVQVDPAKVGSYKPPAGFKVIATSPGNTKSVTTTVNKPGSYTKYNRAASYLKSLGWSQADIKSSLKQYHP